MVEKSMFKNIQVDANSSLSSSMLISQRSKKSNKSKKHGENSVQTKSEKIVTPNEKEPNMS